MRGGLLLAVVLALPLSAGGEVAPDERVRAALRESVDASYQTILPGEGAETQGKGRVVWRKRAVGGDTPAAPQRRIRREAPVRGETGGALGAAASVLMWSLVAVGVGVLLAYGVRELYGEGGDGPQLAQEAAASGVDRAVVEKPLSDADELAATGRYAEAIHTLLLRTLRELASRSRTSLPRSLTSREILERVDLGDEARATLGDLVTAAELCHFGDADPVQADYERCRRQFHVFAAAYQAAPRVAAA